MSKKEIRQPDERPFVPSRNLNREGGTCSGGSSGSCGACSGSSCACGTGGGECAFIPSPENDQEDR